MSPVSGGVPGGGAEFGGGGAGERLAVAQARDHGAETGQPVKRGGCLGPVDAEYPADNRAVRAACGGVSGEQRPARLDP